MNRRSVIASVAACVVLPGCMGDGGGGFLSDADDADESNGDDEPEYDEVGESMREQFERRDLTVNDVEREDDRIVVQIQTSGDEDEDLRAAAEAYVNEFRNVELDLFVRVEDRGLTVESFTIEYEWARQFAEDEISNDEYIELITDTRS